MRDSSWPSICSKNVNDLTECGGFKQIRQNISLSWLLQLISFKLKCLPILRSKDSNNHSFTYFAILSLFIASDAYTIGAKSSNGSFSIGEVAYPCLGAKSDREPASANWIRLIDREHECSLNQNLQVMKTQSLDSTLRCFLICRGQWVQIGNVVLQC